VAEFSARSIDFPSSIIVVVFLQEAGMSIGVKVAVDQFVPVLVLIHSSCKRVLILPLMRTFLLNH